MPKHPQLRASLPALTLLFALLFGSSRGSAQSPTVTEEWRSRDSPQELSQTANRANLSSNDEGLLKTAQESLVQGFNANRKKTAQVRQAFRAEAAPSLAETSMLGATTSTSTDFLSFFSLAGLISEDSSSSNSEVLAFDVNALQLLSPLLNTDYRESKVQLLIRRDPSIFQGFQDLIPETSRADTVASLDKKLSDFADYSIVGTFSLTPARSGQGFDFYEKRYGQLLAAAFDNELPAAKDRVASTSPLRFVASQTLDSRQIADAFGQLDEQAEKEATEAAKSKLDLFKQLVANKQQLNLDYKAVRRDDLAGPDENSLKLSFRTGYRNLKSLAREHSTCAVLTQKITSTEDTPDPAELAEVSECLDKLTDYLQRNRRAIEAGDGFKLAYEYMEIDDVTIRAAGLEETFAEATKQMLTVGYGRILRNNKDDGSLVRFAADFTWEDVSDDPKRRDRGVGTMTWTYQSKQISYPLSIVWATKPEFLGEVDQKLSAHIGIKYSFNPRPNETSGQ